MTRLSPAGEIRCHTHFHVVEISSIRSVLRYQTSAQLPKKSPEGNTAWIPLNQLVTAEHAVSLPSISYIRPISDVLQSSRVYPVAHTDMITAASNFLCCNLV